MLAVSKPKEASGTILKLDGYSACITLKRFVTLERFVRITKTTKNG